MDEMNIGFQLEDFYSTFGQRMRNIYKNHPRAVHDTNWSQSLSNQEAPCSEMDEQLTKQADGKNVPKSPTLVLIRAPGIIP
jgi:hypothetical protein